MTFAQILEVVCNYCNFQTTGEAATRVGKAINRHYRRVTTKLGMDTTRFVTRAFSTVDGSRTATVSSIEHIDRIIDVTGDTRLLQEVDIHQIRSSDAGEGQPTKWAVQNTGPDFVTVVFDTIPDAAYSLQADGTASLSDLSGSDEPAFPESYHDILAWSVLAEELLKKEKPKLALEYERKAANSLAELVHQMADSPTKVTRQRGSVVPALTGGAGSGAVAESLSFIQSGTGAVLRTAQAKMRDLVSVKDFGATGDGVTDDTGALQKAIDSGFPLYFPSGTYLVRLSASITLEGGATVCALKAKTGMALHGDGIGKTIIKVKDDESTDASPKYWNVIAGNGVLEDVIIDGITFDMNGDNNKISPERESGTYNFFNCAALMVSGSVGTVGVDARLVNSRITNCEFKNCPGVTCIAVAQSNATGTTLGNNIEIAHNVFHNNGLDANDHTSIYMWAEGVNVHDNVFSHPTMSSGVAGPYAAAELHGSRNAFRNNQVYNYAWGVYVCGNLTAIANDLDVSDNTFIVSKKAVRFFVESETEPGFSNVSITNNKVLLTGDFTDLAPKKCFDLVPSYGAVDGVVVSDNIIYTTDTYGAYAIQIGSLAEGTSIRNVTIHRNLIKGFATPVRIGIEGGDGSIDNVDVRDNQLVDIQANDSVPTLTIGVFSTGECSRVSIADNVIWGADSSHPYFGIYLDAGTMVDLSMSGNVVDGNATVPISDNVTVSGRRSGEQATTFSALPDQSTWKIGDIAFNSSIAELGSASSKYVVDGWRRITAGTDNVLNTDWVERRSLTGN